MHLYKIFLKFIWNQITYQQVSVESTNTIWDSPTPQAKTQLLWIVLSRTHCQIHVASSMNTCPYTRGCADMSLARPGRKQATTTKLGIYSCSSWSRIAIGNNLDRAEKIPKVAETTGTVDFLIRVQAFRDPLRGELPHVQIFMNDGPNPLTWDAQLLSYWFGRNPAVFHDWLVNLINNRRGGHCFGLSRTRHITGGKITTGRLPVFDAGIRCCMFL